MSNIQSEYSTIRSEMLQIDSNFQIARNILFTAVSALIVFILSQEKIEPIQFIIPFIVIIPMFYISLVNWNNLFRSASYIIVFMDKDYKWDLRLIMIRRKTKNHILRRYINALSIPFISTALVCIVLFYIYLFRSNIFAYYYLEFYLGIAMTIIMLLITLCQKDPDDLNTYYIEKWKAVKKEELANDKCSLSIEQEPLSVIVGAVEES